MNKHGGYYGQDYKEIIDFSININPLGPSCYIKQKMKEAIETVHRYPEIKGERSIKVLAQHLGRKGRQILLGNGAIELIYLFVRSLQPQKALVLGPTFNEYRRAFQLSNTKVLELSRILREEIYIDKEILIKNIYKLRPDVLVLCNPNNPTGDYISPKEFAPVLEVMDEIGGWTMIDESFLDFTEKESFEREIDHHQLFLLRSMTKFYSLPGIRLGYGLGKEDLIEKLEYYKEPWTMNNIALEALPYILRDQKFIQQTLEWIRSERKFFYESLKTIPVLKVFEPNANFILFHLEKGNPKEFFQFLLNHKIYIRSCEDFQNLGEDYFRVAIKMRENNQWLLECINQWSTRNF